MDELRSRRHHRAMHNNVSGVAPRSTFSNVLVKWWAMLLFANLLLCFCGFEVLGHVHGVWDPRASIQMHSDTLRCVQMRADVFGLFWFLQEAFVHVCAFSQMRKALSSKTSNRCTISLSSLAIKASKTDTRLRSSRTRSDAFRCVQYVTVAP